MSRFTRPALCVLATLISLKLPSNSARWRVLINLTAENNTYNRPWLSKGRVGLGPSLSFQKGWLRGSRNQPKHLCKCMVWSYLFLKWTNLSYKQTFGLPDGTFQSLLTLEWGGTQRNSRERDRPLEAESVKQRWQLRCHSSPVYVVPKSGESWAGLFGLTPLSCSLC